jgi:hypothetical protein
VHGCTIIGCGKPTQYRNPQYCASHHGKYYRFGDPLHSGPARQHSDHCSVAGCNEPYRSRSYCAKHYRKFQKYGDPLGSPAPKLKIKKKCSVDGCDLEAASKGYCHRHYNQMYLHGRILSAGYIKSPSGRRNCVIDKCERKRAFRGGYCSMHGRRLRQRDGNVSLLDISPSPVGKCRIRNCDKQRSETGRCDEHTGKTAYELTKERIKASSRRYRVAHRTERNRREKERRERDPGYRLAVNLRNRIRKVLRGMIRNWSISASIGCTPDELRQHFENQFHPHPESGAPMTWQNYGIDWHADHIVPISFAETIADIERLNHYSNLRPFWRSAHAQKTAEETREYWRRKKAS